MKKVKLSNALFFYVFDSQINSTGKRVDKDTVDKLKGRSFYDKNYEIGDKVLWFLTSEIERKEKENEPTIILKTQTIKMPDEINSFINDFYWFDSDSDSILQKFIYKGK